MMGRYDWFSIAEAPDEKEKMKALLTIGSQGSVITETLAATPAEKAAKIIAELP